MIIRKIVCAKRNIFHLEGFSLQIVQNPRVGFEIEGEFVGIQRLLFKPVFAVDLTAAVLAVTQQGMAGISELGADLMGASGEQLAFHQTQLAPACQRFIIGNCRLCAGGGGMAHKDLLFHLVLE